MQNSSVQAAPSAKIPDSKTVINAALAKFKGLFKALEWIADRDTSGGYHRLAAGWIKAHVTECIKEAITVRWGPYHDSFFASDNEVSIMLCRFLGVELPTIQLFVADILDTVPYLGGTTRIEVSENLIVQQLVLPIPGRPGRPRKLPTRTRQHDPVIVGLRRDRERHMSSLQTVLDIHPS